MKHSHGTYSKHSRNLRTKGRGSAQSRLRPLAEGQRVRIDVNPVYNAGRLPLRFQGRVGVVMGKQGDAYRVRIHDGNKEKTFYTLNVHLRPV